MKIVVKIVLGIACILSMMLVSNGSYTSTAHAVTDAKNPDFGPNVITFDQTSTNVQTKMDEIFNKQYMNQFGDERYAVLFKPGNYNLNTNLGYYTTVSGLGQNPKDVVITGGVGAINQTDGSGGLNNFWRSMENFTIAPTNQGQKNFWGVSQASPMRRLNIKGDLVLSDPSWNGFVSGGFIADSKIDGTLFNISQQQWLTRDSEIGSNSNGVWNQVFSGVVGAPTENFPPNATNANPYTVLSTTPESKEKPYMYIDANGVYNIFVPSVRHDSSGTTWATGQTQGKSLSLDKFYVAKPTDSAASINAALASGLHLIFTPGIYNIDQTINITRNDTIVYGMGLATLRAVNGVIPMKTADVSGVSISGLMFEAGSVNSPTLLQIGDTQGVATKDTPNTTHDVFFRVGGAQPGKVTTAFTVNSANSILDNSWVWRGDHGAGIGWNVNTSDHGVVVNGDNVLTTGFFVEHFQKYQVVWNGENGKTIMFQNEIPYDVPDQASWMNGTTNGYAAYKVADHVKVHDGYGLGSYSFFQDNHSVKLDHSFEVPRKPGVNLKHIVTVSLQNFGEIVHLVNDLGESTTVNVQPGATSKFLKEYPIITKGIQIDTVEASDVKSRVAGVTYEVKDENGTVVATAVSEKAGVFTSKDLRYGTYTITQKTVPAEYKLDPVSQTVTLTEQTPNGAYVTFKMLPADGSVTVYAVDAATPDKTKALSGSTFEVYDENNVLVATKQTTTSAVFNLAPGKYTVKETGAPQGYQSQTSVYTIVVESNKDAEVLVPHTQMQGTLTIDVIDSETNKALTGASFEVYNENNVLVDTKVAKTAQVVFSLAPGKYTIKEKTAPQGYLLPVNTYDVVVEANKDVAIVAKHVKALGTVTIYALDYGTTDKTKSLSGAIFEVYDENNVLVDTKETHSPAVFTLAPGKYTIKEKTAPQGYQLIPGTYEVVIEVNKNIELLATHVKVNAPVQPTNPIKPVNPAQAATPVKQTVKVETVLVKQSKTADQVTENLPDTGGKFNLSGVLLMSFALIGLSVWKRKISLK